MHEDATYTGPALYVPIALEALILTSASYNAAWSWSAPNYNFLDRFRPVDPPPFSSEKPAIPGHTKFRGVVLHWALPDGLTYGRAGLSGSVEYPHIPNRWLVVRKSISSDKKTWSYTSWIIASDYRDDKAGSAFVTAEGKGIAIGRSWLLEEWPGEHVVSAAAISPPLTAMGAGEATYAAFAPNVPTVLSFPDPLTDVASGPLSYSVFGWYAGAAIDPLRGEDLFENGWETEDEWKDVLSARSWSVGDDADLAMAVDAGKTWAAARHIPIDPKVPREVYPSRTLCHGLLFEVAWQGPEGPYTSGAPTNNPESAGYVLPQVAFGASTNDALSALIAVSAERQGFDKKKISELENIIAAFQCDGLPLLDQADGQAQLDLRLQNAWFAGTPGGTMYSVVDPQKEQQPGEKAPPVLTPEQRTLLTALNTNQRLLDSTEAALSSQQRALFMLWWKKKRLPTKNFPPPREEQLAELLALASAAAEEDVDAQLVRWLALRGRRDEALISLEQTLGELRIVSAPRASFAQANEPVLMVTGAHRGFKHGEDARFGANGELFCRFTGQSISGIELEDAGQKISVAATQLNPPVYPGSELPRELDDLCAEHAMLDLSNAPLISMLALPADPWSLLERVREEQTLIWNADINAPLDRRTIAELAGLRPMFELGALPSKIGVGAWTAPWSPLFVDWKVSYFPGSETPEKALESWTFSGGPDATDPRDDFTYQWSGLIPPPEERSYSISGRTFLTPQATDTFGAQLEKAIELYADQPETERDLWALQTALDYVSNADLLSQSMSGFNAALLETEQQVFATPKTDDPVARFLRPALGTPASISASPNPDVEPIALTPIRAGHIALEQLWIVDGFGQVFDVLAAMRVQPINLAPIRATDLSTPGNTRLIELKPRITQPARLLLEMLSAEDDASIVGVDTDSDPICGWLIPNRLDRSVLVYDANGASCGELFVAKDAARWFPSPKDNKPPHGGPPKVEIENRHLFAIITNILEAKDSRGALEALLALIDEVSFAIDATGGWGDQAMPALVGEPIAVVRGRVALELLGAPAQSQRWDDSNAHVTGGFEKVAFPVQLGSTELLDDGLIGVYLNDDYRQIETVYTPGKSHDYVAHHRPALKAGGPETLLTMLLAPRTKVHALCGILPAASMTLPGHLATPRLERMEMLFRVGPVVGDSTGAAMPLPSLRSGTWSWVQYDDTERPARSLAVTPATAIAQLPDAPSVAREGWLSLVLDGAPTVLTYSVAPATVPVTVDPDAPSASVLEISGYNASDKRVVISRIRFQIPVGEKAEELTEKPELIVPRIGSAPGFGIESDGHGNITLIPSAGGFVEAGATLRILLAGVQINRSAGRVLITVEETSENTHQAVLELVKTQL
jgi:hypothetical protein